jgi:hypothetical protein
MKPKRLLADEKRARERLRFERAHPDMPQHEHNAALNAAVRFVHEWPGRSVPMYFRYDRARRWFGLETTSFGRLILLDRTTGQQLATSAWWVL